MTVQDDVIRAIMNKTIAGYRTYAAQLWELGKVLADMQTVGMPTIGGEQVAVAKRMFSKFKSAEDASNAVPVQLDSEYVAKLEDFLGSVASNDMKKRLAAFRQSSSSNQTIGIVSIRTFADRRVSGLRSKDHDTTE